ncbi:hypothetical protein H8356DRAFT_1432478 [Neocallimastix lanati (nom. inval.)]|nr:hypothetical protein H8356DRAFT_1432478 [Neocallimastix sp. JGI-2020a]
MYKDTKIEPKFYPACIRLLVWSRSLTILGFPHKREDTVLTVSLRGKWVHMCVDKFNKNNGAFRQIAFRQIAFRQFFESMWPTWGNATLPKTIFLINMQLPSELAGTEVRNWRSTPRKNIQENSQLQYAYQSVNAEHSVRPSSRDNICLCEGIPKCGDCHNISMPGIELNLLSWKMAYTSKNFKIKETKEKRKKEY